MKIFKRDFGSLLFAALLFGFHSCWKENQLVRRMRFLCSSFIKNWSGYYQLAMKHVYYHMKTFQSPFLSYHVTCDRTFSEPQETCLVGYLRTYSNPMTEIVAYQEQENQPKLHCNTNIRRLKFNNSLTPSILNLEDHELWGQINRNKPTSSQQMRSWQINNQRQDRYTE